MLALKGKKNIGTTLRGIGPCYRDKVGRTTAIQLGDLYREGFKEKVHAICELKKSMLAGFAGKFDADLLNPETTISDYSVLAERLQSYVGDTNHYLLDAAESGKRILFEGAQGSLLDLDHGTYPFVTSSNSSGVGISSGSGLPGKWIDEVIGVAKCYSTRV